MFSPSNIEISVVLLLVREVVIPILFSKILLYLPVDVAKLGEPRKFLCVSFLILSYPLPFILWGLHASSLTVVSEPSWLVLLIHKSYSCIRLLFTSTTLFTYTTLFIHTVLFTYVTVGVYRKSVR